MTEQFNNFEGEEKKKIDEARERLKKKVEDIKQKVAKNPHYIDWMLAGMKVDELPDEDLILFIKTETDDSLRGISPEELVQYRSEKIMPYLKKKDG